MVENCLSTAAFCVCAALVSVLLRQYCREQSMLAALGCCGAVLAGFIAFLSPLIEDVRTIFLDSGISEGYISLVFKALAVSFITQITCELCRDCGESAIAAAAELWGRGALTFMALPLVKSLLDLIGQLVKEA